MSNKQSRARELLLHLRSHPNESLEIPEEDRRAMVAVIRYVN